MNGLFELWGQQLAITAFIFALLRQLKAHFFDLDIEFFVFLDLIGQESALSEAVLEADALAQLAVGNQDLLLLAVDQVLLVADVLLRQLLCASAHSFGVSIFFG